MRDFIDLPGASGASYRFRLWPEGASHLPIAGNFAYIAADDGFAVVVLGESGNLSEARAGFARATRKGATHVYTRLNVARATRRAEHADLAASHSMASVLESAN
jgi:hypothetical protein